MKIARGRELLTLEQRENFMKIPEEDWALGSYYTFSKEDLELINKHRRDENKLGFAVQLAVLRFPGWPFTHVKSIPTSVIRYVANQLELNYSSIFNYPQRENTLWAHLKEIREKYEYSSFTDEKYKITFNHIFKISLENEDALHLINVCLNFLRANKIILPAITTLEKIVWEAKLEAEKVLMDTVSDSLTAEQKESLDNLLLISYENSNKTTLGWLKEPVGFPSPDTFLSIAEKIEYIRTLNVESTSINHFHPQRLSQTYRLALRYEPYALRDFKDSKRYALLVILLINLSKDLIDKAFDIHHRQMLTLFSKGRKTQEQIQQQNGKKLNEKVIHFASLGQALIKAKQDGVDPFEALDKIFGWDSFVSSVEEAQGLARPIDFDYLDLLQTKFYFLRRYTPTLLRVLEFTSTKTKEPLIDAISVIKELNQTGKRKIPLDVPIEFISKRWKKYLYDEDGSINRHYYEMAVLEELREHVKSGDISITGSKQYMDFEEYILSKDAWEKRKINIDLAVDVSYEVFMKERIESLNTRLKWFSKNFHQLKGVSFSNGKLSLSRLEKDFPEEAKKLSSSLYQLIPRIKLTELLMDVAKMTGFHEEFTHASTNKKPDNEETITILATLLAMGTNIGLGKMADATPNITYKQLANVSQWRMYDEALNRAQKVLVNFHHKLSLSKHWGDGTTSSSDGMRMELGVSSLHADSNPHYGTGKGATIYRFTSDQFSTYSARIIPTSSRDAPHMVDGLLNNNTDLNIHEHFTDTAGYTDQVFGLTHLFGFRFAPRLRDLADSKLFTLSESDVYVNINEIFRGKINKTVIKENYDEVLRVASSIKDGKVSAALMLNKLSSYSRQNGISTALREMGKIEKTIFILDYLSSEELRRKIQKGLNKGEAMNGLARAIFFGKQGELRERTVENQLQRASALNIIINAISIWNTLYLEKAIEYRKKEGNFNEELIANISPLGWEHINLLGEYTFNSEDAFSREGLRELNIP